MPTDYILTRQIEDALLRDHRVSGQKIQVSNSSGFVTLRGSVQSYRRKLAAQEIVALFDGCRGVDNQLTVVSPEHLSDDEIANHVRLALEADADITKRTITISVEGGIATLGGTVGRPWERVLAEDVVMGVRGVREVRNHILVDPIEQVEDEALSRAISATLAVTRGLGNTIIHVATNGGHVVLSGEVAELWQKEVAITVVRRFQTQWITDKIIVVSPE